MQPFFQEYHEAKIFEFEDSGIFKEQPIHNDYQEDEEKISTLAYMEYYRILPLFDGYDDNDNEIL